jgi:hypothetical protein
METRVAKLEADVSVIKVDVGTILSNYATKADLHELSSTMVKWIVGTVSGLGVVGMTVMTFVLNNATPKAASAPLAPIVITVPTPVASGPAQVAAPTSPQPQQK